MKHTMKRLLLGPSFFFDDGNGQKKMKVDVLPLVSLGLFVLLAVALIVLRGFNGAMQDLSSFFSTVVFSFDFHNALFVSFFVSLLLVLAVCTACTVYDYKKKCTCLWEYLTMILALLSVFFCVYFALRISVNAANVATWLIVAVPNILLSLTLLVTGLRMFYKWAFAPSNATPEARAYFDTHVGRLVMVLNRLWGFVKSIGLGIWHWVAGVGKKTAGIVKSIGASFSGPQFGYFDKKKKNRDPVNLTMGIAFIFAVALFLIIRGFSQAFSDIGNAFVLLFTFRDPVSICFFCLLALSIVGVVFAVISIYKRKYFCLSEGVSFILFEMTLMFMTYLGLSFGITSTNWLIWLVMEIPAVVFAFTLFIKSWRFFYKLAFGKASEERTADFAMRLAYLKHSWRHFLTFMKKNWGQVLVVIALITLAVAVLYPLVILLMRSFKYARDDLANPFDIPTRVTFDNYKFMWEYLKTAYLNSLLTTIGVTLGTMILASFAAYAFIRFHFPAKNVIFYCIIGLMMIPGILTLISRFQLVNDMGLVGSLWGIILPGIAGYIPMAFMLLFTFFKGIPKDLFEAADIDGANDFGVFANVVVPLSKPILSTIAIQTFVGEWNDYLWAYLIVGSNEDKITLPVLLQSLSSSYESQSLGMSAPFAGYVLSAIPLILIFIVASKQFIEGLTSGAFKM